MGPERVKNKTKQTSPPPKKNLQRNRPVEVWANQWINPLTDSSFDGITENEKLPSH